MKDYFDAPDGADDICSPLAGLLASALMLLLVAASFLALAYSLACVCVSLTCDRLPRIQHA